VETVLREFLRQVCKPSKFKPNKGELRGPPGARGEFIIDRQSLPSNQVISSEKQVPKPPQQPPDGKSARFAAAGAILTELKAN
jgi:hypothetical protein